VAASGRPPSAARQRPAKATSSAPSEAPSGHHRNSCTSDTFAPWPIGEPGTTSGTAARRAGPDRCPRRRWRRVVLWVWRGNAAPVGPWPWCCPPGVCPTAAGRSTEEAPDRLLHRGAAALCPGTGGGRSGGGRTRAAFDGAPRRAPQDLASADQAEARMAATTASRSSTSKAGATPGRGVHDTTRAWVSETTASKVCLLARSKQTTNAWRSTGSPAPASYRLTAALGGSCSVTMGSRIDAGSRPARSRIARTSPNSAKESRRSLGRGHASRAGIGARG
jgi:hypothetical protein